MQDYNHLNVKNKRKEPIVLIMNDRDQKSSSYWHEVHRKMRYLSGRKVYTHNQDSHIYLVSMKMMLEHMIVA